MAPNRVEFNVEDPELLPFLRALEGEDEPYAKATLLVPDVDSPAINTFVETMKDWFRGPTKPFEKMGLERSADVSVPTWIFER